MIEIAFYLGGIGTGILGTWLFYVIRGAARCRGLRKVSVPDTVPEEWVKKYGSWNGGIGSSA